MTTNPEYEIKRWIHFGACSINAILVIISVVAVLLYPKSGLANEIMSTDAFRGLLAVYFLIFFGIESFGMLGAFYEQSCLTITYIIIDVLKLIVACANPSGWFVAVFYFASLVTAIRFLASLSDELRRRQLNHVVQFIASPQALPVGVQSAFQPLSGQSSNLQAPPVLPFVQVLPEVSVQPLPESALAQPIPGQSPIQQIRSTSHELLQQPLPLDLSHPTLPLTDDAQSPSQVINVTEMTATYGQEEYPPPPSYEESKSDSSIIFPV